MVGSLGVGVNVNVNVNVNLSQIELQIELTGIGLEAYSCQQLMASSVRWSVGYQQH